MNLPIDHNNKEQFQYIISILRGKGDIIEIPDGTILFPNKWNVIMPLEVMRTFAERYNKGEIQCPYKYEAYIEDKDLQTVISGLQLDTSAFWLLVMFCFDFACSVCMTGFTVRDSAQKKIEKFVNLTPDDESSAMKLTLKTGKGKIEMDDSRAISYILQWVKQAYEQNKEIIRGYTFDEAKNMIEYKNESDSVLIWYFASLLKDFFELNPQFDGKRKKGEIVSLNKNLLISKLIYYTHISTNENFKHDAETLKGFFKQYKHKQMTTHSSIYY